jgi:outer membrane protein assembly factor BamB
MQTQRILVYVLLVLTSLCFLPPVAQASDDWSMFRHDLNRTGSTDGGSADSAMLLWNYSTNGPIHGSPAIVNGSVFFGSRDNNIYSLNVTTGHKNWNFSTGAEVLSSPAVSRSLLYAYSNDGWFYCLNSSTGQPIWIKWLGWNANSCPTVDGDQVYVGSGNHDVVCFNATDGEIIWRYPTPDWVLSSPAVANGVLYVACNDFYVHAVNATTGEEMWKTRTGSATSSPAVYNGAVYIGSYGGYLFCLNAQNGSIRWTYQTHDTVVSSPAVADGCVYFGSQDNSVYCLNATTGQKLWKTETGYWVVSSPALMGGCIYVGSEDYNIYCFNVSTGQKLWAYTTGNQVVSSPAVADGELFVGSFDGNFYAFSLYNNTGEPVTVQSSVQVGWTTIAFDVIAITVAASIVFLAANYYRSNWEKRKLPPRSLMPKAKGNWLTRNTDALCFLVVAGFVVSFYLNLSNNVLWEADEQTYSQMAYYMVKSGDYLNLHAFGQLAIGMGKPPMLMWLMSLSYQAFGVSDFAARFFSPVFGAVSLVFVYFVGKHLYNRAVGFLSVLFLGTFSTFYLFATHAMTDIILTCFILGSFYFFVLSQEKNTHGWYAPLSGIFFGLAFLTKQTGALLIPVILVAYLVFSQRSLKPLFTRQFGFFLAAALAVLAPWVIYMNACYGFDFWNCYFLYSTVTRLASPIEGHLHGYFYYFGYLASSETLLWVTLLPFAVGLSGYYAFKRHKADFLVVTWIAVVLAVFTLAQTKIYYYILPAYPAFALAIASLIYQIGYAAKKRLGR